MKRATDVDVRIREHHEFLCKHGLHGAPSNPNAAENSVHSTTLFFGVTRQTFWSFLRDRFVVDSSQDYYYYWIEIVSLAYIYNLFVGF